jgi:hypothetical protein
MAFDIDILLFGAKICAICGREKARNTEQFDRDASSPDGLHRNCKQCRRPLEAERYRKRRAKAAQP